MELKKYLVKATVMTVVVIPLIFGIGGVVAAFTMGIGSLLSVPIAVVVWCLYLRRRAKKGILPEKLSFVLLPVFLAFGYYMLVWVVLFGVAGYSFDVMTNQFFSALFFTTLPYFGASFIFGFLGIWAAFPVMYGVVAVVLSIATIFMCKNRTMDKLLAVSLACVVCFGGIAAYQFYARGLRFVDHRTDAQRIGDEVDMRRYRPFAEDNHLVEMPWTPDIVFTENFPRLDGATAAYPVFAAMAQGLFEGLDADTVREYVSVSRTDVAYERLINGEIDIFFGAQPSQSQVEAARARGIEFTLTPIAQEAFVFFVHYDNPVESLMIEQIQRIYQRRITNWRQVGGNNERILPFQRPANSGSQTVMEAVVMHGVPMTEPLQQEWIGGMGEAVASVAIYRNYTSAIGYSFRYFVTGMRPHEDIRLLAIDGIEPTPENIQNGMYPFTINVYAVTAGTQNENAHRLIEWILSEQGQAFIELCGIVPIKTEFDVHEEEFDEFHYIDQNFLQSIDDFCFEDTGINMGHLVFEEENLVVGRNYLIASLGWWYTFLFSYEVQGDDIRWQLEGFDIAHGFHPTRERESRHLTDAETVTMFFHYAEWGDDITQHYVIEEVSGEILWAETIRLMRKHNGTQIWDFWFEGDRLYIDVAPGNWRGYTFGTASAMFGIFPLISTFSNSFPYVREIEVLFGGIQGLDLDHHGSFSGTYFVGEGFVPWYIYWENRISPQVTPYILENIADFELSTILGETDAAFCEETKLVSAGYALVSAYTPGGAWAADVLFMHNHIWLEADGEYVSFWHWQMVGYDIGDGFNGFTTPR